MGQAAQKVTSIKDGKQEKPKLYQRKARFEDNKKSRLDMYAKQQQNGAFKFYAVLEKAGQKKQRGMVAEFPSREKADGRFDEVVAQCTKAGWKQTVTWTKSAFEEIPTAE